MKKKYSDPLVIPSVMLTGIGFNESDQGGEGPINVEIPLNSVGGTIAAPVMNSAPTEESAGAVSLNPVEEAVSSEEILGEEVSSEAGASSPLEAESVIDMLVPDGTASSEQAGE